MHALGDRQRLEEKRGKYCSTDNEPPKSEEIASAAAVRNFSCQSLEMLDREPDRKTDKGKYGHNIHLNVFIFTQGQVEYKLRLGRRNST